MKILFVYPHFPDTFWSYKHALKLISKKAIFPPLAPLTVAAMLPEEWEKKLIDMNVTGLDDRDILWADYVFLSAMEVQKESAIGVISRCNKLNRKVVAGGPLFTSRYDEIEGVDHFVLGEAEVTLAPFLADLAKGCVKHIYISGERPDLSHTPLPLWPLINMKDYASMTIQYSRGCPFDCEFCDIVSLYGHQPRTKNAQQIVNELEALYKRGWRGQIFIVDDNFIGNKNKLKNEILPAMIEWMKLKNFPFTFSTELSINLADDEELMHLMASANFNILFIGIETPNNDSLIECNKLQNKGRDLLAATHKIQNHGFEVQGGFIVGFDSDPVCIFQNQIDFIQKSGIVVAMVSILNALHGTKLYERLKSENRLLAESTGNNTDCSLNFIPKMDYELLMNGYRRVLDTIYSPENYAERVHNFLREYRPPILQTTKPRRSSLYSFIKAFWFLGVADKNRDYFWKLLISTAKKYPRFLLVSIRFAVYDYHFYKLAKSFQQIPVLPKVPVLTET